MIQFTPDEVHQIAQEVGVSTSEEAYREHMSDLGNKLHDTMYEFVVAVLRAAEVALSERDDA